MSDQRKERFAPAIPGGSPGLEEAYRLVTEEYYRNGGYQPMLLVEQRRKRAVA